MESKLRVVHFCTSDKGGANRATVGLHKALKSCGVDSVLLVRDKFGRDKNVVSVDSDLLNKLGVRFGKVRLVGFGLWWIRNIRDVWFGKKLKLPFSFNSNQSRIDWRKVGKFLEACDVVCLHWVDGFLSVEDVRKLKEEFGKEIVWTLWDLEPIRGGYHYDLDFKAWIEDKKVGKKLKDGMKEKSRNILEEKVKRWKDLEIAWVPVTSWLERELEKSVFGKGLSRKILLSVDINVYKKISRLDCRKNLKLAANKKVVFVGARNFYDKRKGGEVFKQTLSKLADKLGKKCERVLILTAGDNVDVFDSRFEQVNLGMIGRKKLSWAYNASDVFVCPSIEDGGPMMINEAVMCKTPVVCFDMGVARDLVGKRNGYVARLASRDDLMRGIYKILFDTRSKLDLKIDKRCMPEYQAKEYVELFSDILGANEK